MWIPNIDEAQGPIYLAIADALEADISSGALDQGYRLPPQRELAYQLGVTLGTVTRAYGEAERRRLVKGETGRGTYVAPETHKVSPLVPTEDEADVCDLARNFAYPHLNPSLSDGLVRMARTAGIDRLNGFVPSEGLKAHRETGVLVFKDYGLDADPDRVAVTCGAQHGIQVTCQALFRSGDAIAIDRFTYPSIFPSLASLGLKAVSVPALVRPDGGFGAMDPEALAQAARMHGVKGVFLMPNMQNPTTHTMSLEEREALVSVARAHDLKIVEDDPYTPFLPESLPAFGALAPERTASIASIS
ncbi:MAG: PLP-dependent aminotransferase family protein, partial [Hoeflea sp.]|nr:PLP-dependent aminotransferase family protein [Hoeflea sp.]